MRVAAAIAWKLQLVGLVVVAGPQSHLWWGEEYRGPGMNQWDALVVVVFVSVVLAGFLVAAFAVTGWLLRHRLGWMAAVDLALFAMVLGLAVGAGVTARVVDAEPLNDPTNSNNNDNADPRCEEPGA
jgi:hypothetical protein